MRALRAVMGLAIAGAAGCGLLLGDDDLSSNYGDGTPPTSQDGGTTSDGGGATDGPGATDAAASDANAPDAVIAEFGAACVGGDFNEVEPNDVLGQAGTFTSAACGQISSATDADYFKITLPADANAKVRLAYNTSGNAKLSINGPGVNTANGGKGGGGFRSMTLTGASAPSTYVIRLESADETQTYRLLVTR